MYYLKNQATYSNVPMANKKALLYMYIFIGDRRRAHKKTAWEVKLRWYGVKIEYGDLFLLISFSVSSILYSTNFK